jgi:hypothetical protein
MIRPFAHTVVIGPKSTSAKERKKLMGLNVGVGEYIRRCSDGSPDVGDRSVLT